ncbi:hypothetical protein SMUL_1984 [Sulfurospirillum multivorans DSM 12446]|uniref:Uncharacterized protein n=1 Tax=Sulfurospirillum multivorans (strain DM 12446 / JCM 15788 / NBRC 109480) TaxID=1150621 RepID=A0AA86AMH2_SULMK|nr:hypothetical protein SMUL_1984 [Sulfurospirillum multivorans DSM 12446]
MSLTVNNNFNFKKESTIFKVIMNNNIMDTCRTYSQALSKAKKIKALFCKNHTFEVLVEDSKGSILDRF